MAITLGSNIASLRAQRQLFKTEQNLSSVFERLSSGQRINRASDDAAGLAISESLNTDRRVFNQAIRNLNDGLSVLNIADSTVAELSGIVIRIQELAEQAANGSLSSTQRKSLDQEAQELKDEFFRVSRSADFNGLRLFDGSIENGIRLQAGYGQDGSIFSSLGGEMGDGTVGGKATFSTETGSGPFNFSYATALGDLNGDGVLDLVTAGFADNGSGFQGQASVRLGLGDGTFGEVTTFATDTGSSTGLSFAVTLGDLNEDGVLDLVTAGRADNGSGFQGQASVRLGRGDGTFGEVTTFATDTGSSSGQSFTVTLGDLNGDGVLDLVTAGFADNGSGDQGQASIRLGRGDGTFGEVTTFATDTGSSLGRSDAVTLGDLNGDGILDLVTAGYANSGSSQGQASVRLGVGDGTFGEVTTFATDTGSSSGRSEAVTLGDLNGDGILDLVTAGFADNGSEQGQASVRLGVGDGTFGEVTTFATDAESNSGKSRAVTLGDLNGDGVLDLVTAGNANNGSGNQGQASVRLGRGDGTFGEVTTFATDTGSIAGFSIAVTLGDLNGDGVLDLVTAGSASNGSIQGQASALIGQAREGIAPILDFSLKTQADALQALAPLERKLQSLSEQRGTIGAFQSRLQSALNTLSATSENYAAAESRIKDADIAFESSQLTRLNILQQAAAAVLGQANQQPALALQLLS